MKNIILLIVICGLFSSCASRKDLIYFQPDSIALNNNYALNTPKLQSGDLLSISIMSDDLRTTAPFNQVSIYQGTAGNLQNGSLFVPSYTIDANGEIDFPIVGKLKLAGLTRVEGIELIRKKVTPWVVNPGVTIDLKNFKVTVLGEVNRPGTFPISNDRITILEALGMAGDLTINGVRKNVLVIREENGVKQEIRLDLTKRESLNSAGYYLCQNDVVYVEPNDAKIQSSKYTQNTSIFVSIAGLIITIVAVVVR